MLGKKQHLEEIYPERTSRNQEITVLFLPLTLITL